MPSPKEEIIRANKEVVDGLDFEDLPLWIETIEADEDPRKLPEYPWHSWLFLERRRKPWPTLDPTTKGVFLGLAKARLKKGK